jgi:aspartyl-tRNA(Asn)/glutamyl-tRNA(Gln) amidotransferase subunit A
MYYNKALNVRRLITEDLDNIVASCDAYLCPTTTSPALPRNYAVDDPLALYLADIFTVTANLAGIPAVSFPAGFEGHLPIGMQLYTSGLNEQVLFNLIHTFQSETDYHTVKPRFIKEGGSL